MMSMSSLAIVAAFSILISTSQSVDATFAACAAAPLTPKDRRSNTLQLKVTTFNTAFLYLGTESHQLVCPGKDCEWKTPSDATRHVLQIASVIKQLDADIIQLNEVEDCTVLKTLVSELETLGDFSYRPYLVRGTDTTTGQNAALLTRIDPIVNVQRTDARAIIPVNGSNCPTNAKKFSTSKGVAKHLYTTFNVTGFSKPLTLVGAHLLANPTSPSRCFEREAQATVLADLANDAITKGHHVILTGDLNDWSLNVPDKNNNVPISAVLSILEGTTFINVASKVAQSQRYTQWYDVNTNCAYEETEVSSLDHILVSKSLSPALTMVSFNHNLYTTSCSGYNSDHYPISIVLNQI